MGNQVSYKIYAFYFQIIYFLPKKYIVDLLLFICSSINFLIYVHIIKEHDCVTIILFNEGAYSTRKRNLKQGKNLQVGDNNFLC